MLWQRYCEIEQRMQNAIQKADRNRDKIKLIAVSKTKPLSMIEELAEHGVCIFGENKVQELCEKAEAMAGSGIEWHFIGHLQRNKVKQLLKQKPALIHSLDSQRLAREIEKEAEKQDITVPVLIEINIGKEASKSGFFPEEAAVQIEQLIQACPHIRVQGLMCVAPAVKRAEEARPYFRRMQKLRQEIVQRQIPGVKMDELSMGMTGDFEVAIEEGATMLRVGTAIFGERDYGVSV